MAIFNPIAQKEQEEGILSLIMAIYQKISKGRRDKEREKGSQTSKCVFV